MAPAPCRALALAASLTFLSAYVCMTKGVARGVVSSRGLRRLHSLRADNEGNSYVERFVERFECGKPSPSPPRNISSMHIVRTNVHTHGWDMAAGVLAAAALSLSRAADECELPCPVPDKLGARRPREPVLPLPAP